MPKAKPKLMLDPYRHSIAFDPGVHTGVCVANYQTEKKFVVVSSVILDMNEVYNVHQLLHHFNPQHIVIESFKLYQHKASEQIGSSFPSVEVIGIIKAFAHMLDMLDRITFQSASCIHTGGKDALEVLPEHRAKVTRPNGMKHAQDAYLHMRYFYIGAFNRMRQRSSTK